MRYVEILWIPWSFGNLVQELYLPRISHSRKIKLRLLVLWELSNKTGGTKLTKIYNAIEQRFAFKIFLLCINKRMKKLTKTTLGTHSLSGEGRIYLRKTYEWIVTWAMPVRLKYFYSIFESFYSSISFHSLVQVLNVDFCIFQLELLSFQA